LTNTPSGRVKLVPRSNVDDIVRQKPSTCVVIDGPHLALYANPDAAAQAICGVLGTHGVAPLIAS
jgi:hypothetical protein